MKKRLVLMPDWVECYAAGEKDTIASFSGYNKYWCETYPHITDSDMVNMLNTEIFRMLIYASYSEVIAPQIQNSWQQLIYDRIKEILE